MVKEREVKRRQSRDVERESGTILRNPSRYRRSSGRQGELAELPSAAPTGTLLVSTASLGGVWAFDPNPSHVFRPTGPKPNLVALRALTGNQKTKCSNIALDSDGDLYICTNNDDANLVTTTGTIYRFNMLARDLT